MTVETDFIIFNNYMEMIMLHKTKILHKTEKKKL